MYAPIGMFKGSGVGGGGGGAFPTLVSNSRGSSASGSSTSRNIALPGGIVAGQLIVIAVSLEPGSVTVAVPSGFTRISGKDVFSKVAFGGETSVTYVISSSGTASNVTAMVFAGVSQIEAADFESTSAPDADPPSLTVSWGATNNLFMAVYHQIGIGSGFGGYPSNCPLYRSNGGSGLSEAIAGQEVALATFNPATFGTGGDFNTFTIGLAA